MPAHTAERRTTLATGYTGRDFDKGPATYRDPNLEELIFDATGLAFNKNVRVLDLMSGPGKVGLALERLALQAGRDSNHYFFADLSPQLDQAPGVLKTRMKSPDFPWRSRAFHVVVARYAIKDLPSEQQMQTLREANRILNPEYGKLVIADMVSADLETKSWLNKQHAIKQRFGGRMEAEEGRCHIPTATEWRGMLQAAGFDCHHLVPRTYTSRVNTNDWVKGQQITVEQREILDEFILAAPEAAKTAYKIRQEDDGVHIDFPVTVLAVSPTYETWSV